MNKTIWLTGLPCSGKTTIAKELIKKTGGQLLDGDIIRGTPISNDAGFSLEARRKHLLRIACIAKMLNDNNIPVIASFVSPIETVRNEIKDIIGEDNFRLVFVDTPKETCIKRDVKGMWKKALDGEIKDFTGLDSPYEKPINPFLTIKTETTVKACVNCIFSHLQEDKKEYSILIGRYQCLPPHEGHQELVRTLLREKKNVIIGLRDTTISEKNPYTIEERKTAFTEIFAKEIQEGKVVVKNVLDITEVCYGRTPAWNIREIKLDEDLESISATEKRKNNKF